MTAHFVHAVTTVNTGNETTLFKSLMDARGSFRLSYSKIEEKVVFQVIGNFTTVFLGDTLLGTIELMQVYDEVIHL